jgi:hypothetical protein
VETITVEFENDEKTTSNHTEKKHVLEFQQDVNSSLKRRLSKLENIYVRFYVNYD